MEELIRCPWSLKGDTQYIHYHDYEWGVPVHEDQKHFEFLVLEAAQAGLSWSTVLRKREGYRAAFADFQVERIAEFSEKEIASLILNPAIIRNKAKINAVINNAKPFLKIKEEFGSFDQYIWSFVNHQPIVNEWKIQSEVPSTSKESDALSKDLKARGFKFVGSTVIYAHMQATGLINDHLTDCFRYKELSL